VRTSWFQTKGEFRQLNAANSSAEVGEMRIKIEITAFEAGGAEITSADYTDYADKQLEREG